MTNRILSAVIYKEFILSRKSLLAYSAIYLLYLLMSFFGFSDGYLVLAYGQFLPLCVVSTLFSLEYQTNFHLYPCFLPQGRTAFLRGRYSYTLLLSLLFLAISWLILLLFQDLAQLQLVPGLCFSILAQSVHLFLTSLLLPLLYLKGTKRGKPWYFLSIMLCLLLFLLFYRCYSSYIWSWKSLSSLLPLLFLFLCLAYMSLFCSYLFAKKRMQQHIFTMPKQEEDRPV